MPHCTEPCGHELCKHECNAGWVRQLERENQARRRIKSLVARITKELPDFWELARDGTWFIAALERAVREAGYSWYDDAERGVQSTKKKAKIGRSLSRQVMERDGYRCVTCETHINLGCDHIIPESKGGPTTLENLQTMCGPCNSRKGDRL